MTTRRAFLAGLAALPLCAEVRAQGLDGPSLATLARRSGRFFGSAVTSYALRNASGYGALLESECDVWVPEWQMKWGALSKAVGDPPDFAAVDEIAAVAQTQGKRLRGHALLWHEHLPAGVADLVDIAAWDRAVVPHIASVAKRFAGRVFQWDVVNEAIEPRDGASEAMRRTPFLAMRGADYVAAAFHIAHEAAPDARLYLNDYAVCYAESWQEDRRTGVLKLLERLIGQGVPVHGFGIQSHLDTRFAFDPAVFRRFLDELGGLGLELAITELDVREADRSAGIDLATRRLRAADEVRKVMAVALDAPALTGIVTWGLADSESWLRAAQKLPDNQGLPYDDALRDTPMRAALAEVLQGAAPHG